MNVPESSEEVLRESETFLRIANAGVADALADLRAKRVPICFSRNGRIYYEMPDGSIQTENPYPAMMKERGIVMPD